MQTHQQNGAKFLTIVEDIEAEFLARGLKVVTDFKTRCESTIRRSSPVDLFIPPKCTIYIINLLDPNSSRSGDSTYNNR